MLINIMAGILLGCLCIEGAVITTALILRIVAHHAVANVIRDVEDYLKETAKIADQLNEEN